MTFEHTVFSPRMAIGLVISRMHRKALKTFSICRQTNFVFLRKKNDDDQNNISRPLDCGVNT